MRPLLPSDDKRVYKLNTAGLSRPRHPTAVACECCRKRKLKVSILVAVE